MKRLLLLIFIVLFGIVGPADYADALDREAEEKLARIQRAQWVFLGEGRQPATLRDCPPETIISVNTNVGIYNIWRRFCWWGKQ